MGLNPLWQEDVFLTIQAFHQQTEMKCVTPHFIISCNNNLFIHLVPLNCNFQPQELITLQEEAHAEGFQLVHLWEDVWQAKRAQVLSRIRSFLNLNKSFHGRKAKIFAIDAKEALQFLTAHHLQGYVKAKYSYGLFNGDEIIAVATFSETRPMKHKGSNYHSVELVRFASIAGLTIVGGLSKLIKHFLKQIKVDDLMTYADRDWSLGKSYDKLDFMLSEVTEPSYLYVNTTTLIRYFVHRLPKNILSAFEAQNVLNLDDFLAANGYCKLFNTGNLKYHLYL